MGIECGQAGALGGIECGQAGALGGTGKYVAYQPVVHGSVYGLLQAPGRARLASPSNEGSLSYTVGDLKERLRALSLPLHGRKADLLERLKAALAADTAVSALKTSAEAAEEEAHGVTAAAAEKKVKPRGRGAAKSAPDGTASGKQKPWAAATTGRKRVQPGTAGLGSVATAEVSAFKCHDLS